MRDISVAHGVPDAAPWSRPARAAAPQASMTAVAAWLGTRGHPPGAARERPVSHVSPPPRGPAHALEAYTFAHREQPDLGQPRPRAPLPPRGGRSRSRSRGCGAGNSLMTLISTERLYTGRIVNLDRRHGAISRRSTGRLEMLRHPGASAVVPLLDDPRRRIPGCCSSGSSATRPTASSGRYPPAGSTRGNRPRLRRAGAGGGNRNAGRANSSGSRRSSPRPASPMSRSTLRRHGFDRGAVRAARPTSSWSCTRGAGPR